MFLDDDQRNKDGNWKQKKERGRERVWEREVDRESGRDRQDLKGKWLSGLFYP